MTTSLDDLLARAGLAPIIYTQADIDAGQQRLAARLAANPCSGDGGACAADGRRRQASLDLAALCETLVAQPGGLEAVKEAVAPSGVPDPRGARILGCLLALAAAEDSARFWWQYAAGAGDHPAAFCLALYHEAYGEVAAATWWTEQATPSRLAPVQEVRDQLRVLHRLQERPPIPGAVEAAIACVSAAIGWVDEDCELPMPDDGFVSRLLDLLCREADLRDDLPPLPARSGGHHWPPVRTPASAR